MSFLFNSWYCFSWSVDLAEKPVAMRILDRYLVGYRDSAGHPVILDGRCLHRFAPLDQGTVAGDAIVCPYHGLRYGSDGHCILNPNGDGFIPAQATLRAYPALERDLAIWVWMGDPALADESLVPVEEFVSDPLYADGTYYLRIKANYQLVIDNLLDLTHVQFIHGGTLAAPKGQAATPREHAFRTEGDVVHSDYHIASTPVAPSMSNLFDGEKGVLNSKIKWWPSSCLRLDIHLDHHDGRPGVHTASLHYLVPETENSTHYFTRFARNVKIDDEAETARMYEIVEKAFIEQDKPMIEACGELMGTPDLFSLRPLILKTDVAAVQARRILTKKIADERVGQGPHLT